VAPSSVNPLSRAGPVLVSRPRLHIITALKRIAFTNKGGTVASTDGQTLESLVDLIHEKKKAVEAIEAQLAERHAEHIRDVVRVFANGSGQVEDHSRLDERRRKRRMEDARQRQELEQLWEELERLEARLREWQ
jgi:hypothetical protein